MEKFDARLIIDVNMDFVKSLLEESNVTYLRTVSKIKYPILEGDTDSDKEYLESQRRLFIQNYHKRNNRQFELSKTYQLSKYKKTVDDYESRYDIMNPYKE